MRDELNIHKSADLNLTDLNLAELSLDDVQVVSEDDSYALAEGGASLSPVACCSVIVKTAQ